MAIKQHESQLGTFSFVYNPDEHASWWSFDDEQSVRLRHWYINPGDVVLDIGAGFGSYTFPALARGAGRVICWAPEGYVEKIRASLAVNPPDWAERTTLIDGGAWSARGYLSVHEGPVMPAFSSTEKPGTIAVNTVDATVRVLDLARVDWMKLDVEGAEVDVLRGAARTINAHRPRILIENHLFKDPGLKDRCAAFLEQREYKEVGTVPYHSVSHSFYVPR